MGAAEESCASYILVDFILLSIMSTHGFMKGLNENSVYEALTLYSEEIQDSSLY